MNVLPNIITSLRILGGAALIFADPLTVAFFVIYTLSGISDAVDGWIARKLNSVSKLGTRLDSIADLLFYTVMLLKIAPMLFDMLPWGIWIAVCAIMALRILSYTVAAVKYHCFSSLHTYLNKLTGVLLFTVPYFLKTPFGVPICFIVCAVSGVAAIEELIIHVFSKSYNEKTKTLLIKKA